MGQLDRITQQPDVMGGKACIRRLRITAANVMGLLAEGETIEQILISYPDLEPEDIPAVMSYAAWRLQESEQFVPR